MHYTLLDLNIDPVALGPHKYRNIFNFFNNENFIACRMCMLVNLFQDFEKEISIVKTIIYNAQIQNLNCNKSVIRVNLIDRNIHYAYTYKIDINEIKMCKISSEFASFLLFLFFFFYSLYFDFSSQMQFLIL